MKGYAVAMALTFAHGPLSGNPAPTNYRIDGPPHRLLFDDFPRRVRATFGGETVLDTRDGKLVHETGLLPQLYVPVADFRADLLQPTEHSTHCPFKGDASYWSVTVGDAVAENAVWAYLDPIESATWLDGYRGVYWEPFDEWFDEDELVTGHLRDPYHRVDVRRCGQRVRVLLGDRVIADAAGVQLLSETGLPNRLYLPRDSVRAEMLQMSPTTTVCPYKGDATYWSLRVGDQVLDDVAWSYAEPLDESRQIRDHLCFLHDDLTVEVG
jgi:uncharacterized protein (DUF427 family)